MSDVSGKCSVCDRVVSYETGFTLTGGLGDSSLDRLYCPDCAPKTGKGYTLSDMQKWREDNEVARLQHEVAMMELLGPDVYDFMVKTKRDPTPMQRALTLQARTDAIISSLLERPDEDA